ncbi:MAG: aldehyde dehydrogenase family protein, partial [Rhodoferax sp.]|nr:aldehyde dehydrogenase family protein [Rhodoferax sp.]
PGHPLDPDTSMGALIDKAHLERVLSYIEAGSKETDLLLGGKAQTACKGGYYVEPTIFLDGSKRSKVGTEEVFGPVLTVVEFDSPEEALALANRSDYGLAAAVWTADQALAQYMARKLKAGTVWINCYDDLVDMNFPFGGYKQSGNGRDLSLHALDKYTELKTCLQRLS